MIHSPAMLAFSTCLLTTTLLAGTADGEMGRDNIRAVGVSSVERYSTNTNRKLAKDFSKNPVFSPDGQWVAFISPASNLVRGDRNNKDDIFIRSLTSPEIKRVSLTSAGTEANGRSWTQDPTGKSYSPAFSPALGTPLFPIWEIAYPSDATNIVKPDTNGVVFDVFVATMTGS
jgi:tricorn protease-like protein